MRVARGAVVRVARVDGSRVLCEHLANLDDLGVHAREPEPLMVLPRDQSAEAIGVATAPIDLEGAAPDLARIVKRVRVGVTPARREDGAV